jgi:hypothetical protein
VPVGQPRRWVGGQLSPPVLSFVWVLVLGGIVARLQLVL